MGYYSKRANEISIGQWAVGKLQSLVSMIILLKLFDAPTWVYIISAPIIVFGVWFMGYVLVKSGLWASINRETFRGSLYKGQ